MFLCFRITCLTSMQQKLFLLFHFDIYCDEGQNSFWILNFWWLLSIICYFKYKLLLKFYCMYCQIHLYETMKSSLFIKRPIWQGQWASRKNKIKYPPLVDAKHKRSMESSISNPTIVAGYIHAFVFFLISCLSKK